MAFYSKTDPVKARNKLRDRLGDAETAVIAATANTKELALSGADDATLDAAESHLRARADRVATLQAALVQADEQIAELEAERAVATDRKTRHQTADEIEKLLHGGNVAAKEFDVAMTKLADFAAQSAAFIPEAVGLRNYCDATRVQIPEAMAMIGKLAGHHAQAVLAGTAPATLKKPEAPVVAPPVTKAPTIRLFALRCVKFRDADGVLVAIQQFADGDFTPAAALKARSLKAVTELNDPLRRKHHGTIGGHPRVEHALDLDADPAGEAADPIRSSASPFQIVDRGPAINLKHREALR
jgi:hypothetical protein